MKKMLKNLYGPASGGIKAGEMFIYSAGRQTGKSALTTATLQQIFDNVPTFKVLTTAQVDGQPFYTVKCQPDVAKWVRANGVEHTEWVEYIDQQWHIYTNTFDVSQDMLSMIKLTWS